MCEVLDRAEQKGYAIGVAEGRAEGREAAAKMIALNARDSFGMTDPARIARLVGMPEEQVERWLNEEK